MAKAAKDTRPVADQNTSELACTYAALLLHGDGQDIESKKLAKLIQAANIRIEPFYAKVFEKALHGKNVGDLLLGGGQAAPAPSSQPAQTASKDAPKAAEKPKEEPKKEEPAEEVGVGGLFDDF